DTQMNSQRTLFVHRSWTLPSPSKLKLCDLQRRFRRFAVERHNMLGARALLRSIPEQPEALQDIEQHCVAHRQYRATILHSVILRDDGLLAGRQVRVRSDLH